MDESKIKKRIKEYYKDKVTQEDIETIYLTLKENKIKIESEEDLLKIFKQIDEIGKNHVFDCE